MRLIAGILISLMAFATNLLANPVATEDSLHLNWLDKSIKYDQNFYQFANGNWKKENPIPAAYSAWGTFQILNKQNQELIRSLVEAAANNSHNKLGSNEQKVGDFFYSGMDEASINKAGASPLQAEFDGINNIKNLADLQKTITHLQMIGVDALFSFGQMQDFKNSKQVIGAAGQGGLGLPDRDYYLKDDAKFQKIRQAYVQHIAKMFQLLGDSAQQAAAEAKTVMNIETMLAKSSMSLTEQRNPLAIYHPMTLTQLALITPNFSWIQYFKDIHHPEINRINLAMPNFFKDLDVRLKEVSLADWKTYLRWHLIDTFASYLSAPFVNENFNMSATLSGAKELLPRWQRVLGAEGGALGFAIGELFVEKKFPPSSKKAVLEILHNIRKQLRLDLQTLAWMTPETRAAAIKKLDMMGERVGYPDKWRDYSSLQIDRGSYVLNIIRANEFLIKRDLNKIGKPVDKNEWDMTPQTVNAYYDPSMNNINIPAGILQPPFFDPNASAAMNYGAIGFIIGHEMTHGFDDTGAQFDGYGNLKNWWTQEDLKKFHAATDCIADQFSQYTVDDLHVQGKLVVGEATADLGGVTLSNRAYLASKEYQQAKTVAGFTPEQQFFLGAAHIWAQNMRPEEMRQLVVTDEHPPAIFRVNGTFANMSQFQKAYNIGDNSPMVHKPRCVIW